MTINDLVKSSDQLLPTVRKSAKHSGREIGRAGLNIRWVLMRDFRDVLTSSQSPRLGLAHNGFNHRGTSGAPETSLHNCTENILSQRIHTIPLPRPPIEIIVSQNTQESNVPGPVRRAGWQQRARIERNSIPTVHSNTPGTGVVNYSLKVQPRMMGVGFQEGKSFGYFLYDDLLELERLNVVKKSLAWNQLRHPSSLLETTKAVLPRRSHELP